MLEKELAEKEREYAELEEVWKSEKQRFLALNILNKS